MANIEKSKVIYPDLSYKVIGLAFEVYNNLGYPFIKQVVSYLKVGNYKLAIIIYFTKDVVRYRRVLNSDFKQS